LLFFAIIFASNTLAVYANPIPAPDIHAGAYILIDAASGRIMRGHDIHRQMFPASTTKAITAILAYEHIGMDDLIIVGNEVTILPHDSARVGHDPGEAISGKNLLRGMLIGPGNDTANVVAMEVARRISGNPDIPFSEAQRLFAQLMTARARELGARNTNFVNPHGYHHHNHFSTAYDLARLARAALAIPTIAEIAATPAFAGYMAGDYPAPPSPWRSWRSANELIGTGANSYPYAIGFRTGFTNMAGQSMISAAERDGIRLIAVTLNSPVLETGPTRWRDNYLLFEYGFMNFSYHTIHSAYTPLGIIDIYNPRLDDAGTLEFFATSYAIRFLSYAERDRLQTQITFRPQLIATGDEYTNPNGQTLLYAPIEDGQIIGTITYILDDAIIFSANLLAARYVPLRTVNSDVDYHWERFVAAFLSRSALPYWIAATSVLTLLLVLILLLRNNIRKKKNRYNFKMKY